MKIETWGGLFRINNSDVDLTHQTVSGVFISEEPNNIDQIFDYASSKPYIAKWSRHFQDVTNGASFGNVRIMHTSDAVGIITELKFDDKAKTVSGTVHVTDESAWQKVLEHVYTGFSFGGDSKGPLWKDRIASAKFGRLMRRYTFVPRELSLCDKGRIPGTDFTTITNADTQTKEQSMPESEKIENGVTTGAYLAQTLSQIVSLINDIGREEVSEGQTSAIPDGLREALKPFAEAVKEYQVSQIDELVATGNDVDSFSPDDADIPDIPDEVENADVAKSSAPAETAATVENGDVPGHEFHGNQHTSGTSGSASGKASSLAHKMSVSAYSSHSKTAHTVASNVHAKAAEAAKAAGRTKVAAYHAAMATHHASMAKAVKNADTKPEPSKKEECNQADAGKKASAPAAAPVAAPKAVENADVSHPSIEVMFANLTDRLTAIEAKVSTPIANADSSAKPKPFTGPGSMGVVVTREQESAKIENSDIDVEAARIAGLPKEQQGLEILKHQLRSTIR